MSELDPSKMNEEELKAFMAVSPTRDEVNRYLNNVYLSINNAFAAMQGNSIAALSSTIVHVMQEAGMEVKLEDFMKKFTEESIKNMEDIQKRMTTPSPDLEVVQDSAEEAKEVDVSMF
jgi:hypothetical protein